MAVIVGRSFLQSVEFYVICAVVAAAVVAMAVKPSRKSAVVTHLLAGDIAPDPGVEPPRIVLEVLPDGRVALTRYGIDYVGLDGAVSAAVSVNGFDVVMEERLTPGCSGHGERIKAFFILDFFGPERYHFRYSSEPTELLTVTTLAVKPGVKISRPLTR